jgi:hypothetical protein
MAKSIARQGIASRAGIGRRAIATRFGQADQGAVFQYPPGTFTFRPNKAGYWKFVCWGPGGGEDNTGSAPVGSGSGGYVEYTRFMGPAETTTIVVAPPPIGAGVPTTVTFADGRVLSAGPGVGASSGGAGGSASGGDVNLPGSASGLAGLGTGGGAASQGAGAPANLPFRGGDGAGNGSGTAPGNSPGGGGGGNGSNHQTPGGAGQVLVVFIRP